MAAPGRLRRALHRAWSEVRHRAAALVGGARLERELDDELAFHLEMEAAERGRRGVDPAEARRTARAAFGGVERAKEQCRDERGTGVAQDLARDLRFGLRLARREAAFSAVVVLTLALGLGATTAVFSVARAVLLAPLPYPVPEELMLVHNRWVETPAGTLSPAELLDYRDELVGEGRTFRALGAWSNGPANVGSQQATSGGDRPEQVRGAFVTAGLLEAIGVEPALGRGFRRAEEDPGADDVAIIGWDLFQRRFEGDSGVLGRQVRLDGQQVVLVGVMPRGFRLPGDFSPGPTELFLPLTVDPAVRARRGNHFLAAVARRNPGVSGEQAEEAVAATATRFVARYPDQYEPEMRFTGTAVPLHEAVVDDSRPTLLLLLAAAGLVLLVACANVAGLLLARARRRRREMGLRAALGADRRRLVAQVLAESAILAAAGGAAGLAVAFGLVEAFHLFHPPGLPRVEEVALDPTVLAFAAALTLTSCVVFGLLPALRTGGGGASGDPGSPGRLAGALGGGGGRTATDGPAEGRANAWLVAGEVALALILLVTAGLLGRSLLEMVGVDPGFEPAGVVAVDLSLPGGEYSPEQVLAFYAQAVQGVADSPGVERAGAVSFLPLDGGRGDISFEIEGRPLPSGERERNADWQVVTPGYFETVGVRLHRGRFFTAGDRADAPGAVVVNRTLADAYWPDGDALGQRLHLLGGTQPETATVVGVVEDVKNLGLDSGPQREIFLAHQQFRFWSQPIPAYDMTLTARGPDPEALRRAIDAEVARLAPQVPLADFRTLEQVVGRSVAGERFTAALVASFTVLALLLAAVGVYGMLAYAVEGRRREIGIRRVLGADTRSILHATVGRGMLVVAAGAAAGLLAALLAGRLLSGLLFGVEADDPATLAAAVATLLVAGLVACAVPARRALSLDPARELRGE